MIKRRPYLIEATVVVIVLAVLMAVMLPRFFQSQARARVAEARQHLTSLVQAMQAYELDTDISAQQVLLYGKRNLREFLHAGLLLGGELVGSSTGVVLVHASAMNEYLEQLPLPTLPMRQVESYPVYERFYAVGRFKARHVHFRDQLRPCTNADGSFDSLISYHENFNWGTTQYWPEEYVGIAPGPFMAYVLPSGAKGHPAWKRYDPTNGIMSHGFVFTRQ